MTEQTRTTTVSRLVVALADGDPQALDALFPIVNEEIHALAHRQRMRWRGDHTLNTTALVHEAWIRLADRDDRGDGPGARRVAPHGETRLAVAQAWLHNRVERRAAEWK